MPVIKNHAERMARTAEKRHALLRFLRDELYTTPAVAGLVMGVAERAARSTITSMERADLVRRHIVTVVEGLPPVTLVAITSHGQAMAFNPETETVVDRLYEPGRYSLIHLSHRLDTQRLRIAALQSGRIHKWLPGEAMGANSKNIKRPDAVVLTVDKIRVAVEIERSIKNKKRYAGILSGHLTAIRQGKWQRAVWASPDVDTARRVEAILKSISRAQIAGVDTMLTAEHFKPLTFTTYQNLVSNL